MMEFGGGVLERYLNHEGEASMNITVSLQVEGQGRTLCHVRIQQDGCYLQTGKMALTKNPATQAL